MTISKYDFFQPLTEHEKEVAQHEAAHAVMTLTVPNDCVLADTFVFHSGNDDFLTGEVRHINISSDPERPYNDMPPFHSTVPFKWQQAATLAYGALIVFFAGPAQTRLFFDDSMTAHDIRNDPSGQTDNKYAHELCCHFWMPEHVEQVLDIAAETAGVMIQFPRIQGGILALADFLNENKRRKATGIQASAIVRPHVPRQIDAPFLSAVLKLVKRHA